MTGSEFAAQVRSVIESCHTPDATYHAAISALWETAFERQAAGHTDGMDEVWNLLSAEAQAMSDGIEWEEPPAVWYEINSRNELVEYVRI